MAYVLNLKPNFHNMRIRCVKQKIDNLNVPRVYNDMSEYLPLGNLYEVFGIRFSENITYVYIFNGNHLFEVPIEMFSVVDDQVTDKWKIKVWDDGEVTLWPELFYRDGFLENFAEHEHKERGLFEELRAEIEGEA